MRTIPIEKSSGTFFKTCEPQNLTVERTPSLMLKLCVVYLNFIFCIYLSYKMVPKLPNKFLDRLQPQPFRGFEH